MNGVRSQESNTSLCVCGHSFGWHSDIHPCGVDGCECDGFEAACPDEASTDENDLSTGEQR